MTVVDVAGRMAVAAFVTDTGAVVGDLTVVADVVVVVDTAVPVVVDCDLVAQFHLSASWEI